MKEDKLKMQTIHTQLNTTQKKQTTQNTAKQNYPDFVTLYDTRPGNEVRLILQAPELLFVLSSYHQQTL